MNNLKKICFNILFGFGLIIEQNNCTIINDLMDYIKLAANNTKKLINEKIDNIKKFNLKIKKEKARHLILKKYFYLVDESKYFNFECCNKKVIEICEKILKIKKNKKCEQCKNINLNGLCENCIRKNKLFYSCENVNHEIKFDDIFSKYMINAKIIERDSYWRGIIICFCDIKEVTEKLKNFEKEIRDYKEQKQEQEQEQEQYSNHYTDIIQD